MKAIFAPENRIITERRFWVAVLKAQIAAGLEAPASVVTDYEAVIENVDLASIRRRELELKHDIPAKLGEFNALAGHQHAHKGMTSRDLTENVEVILMSQALELVRQRALSILNLFVAKAEKYSDLATVARTHNVPAQPTTVGKRFATYAEELMHHLDALSSVMERAKLRGVKGPVGSAQDQINLLGSPAAAAALGETVAAEFGFADQLTAVGQVYPRSYDFEVASALYALASAPSNFATQVRLMAGTELASEGFGKNQVGSSAMPHKMNARSCERINGLHQVTKGFMDMSASLTGSQWNEGNVACSVVRRVAIPNMFLTIDGLFETTFAVLRGLEFYEPMIEAELKRYLPFLSTTTLLMHAVKAGVGREDAHETIKAHAVETAIEIRNGKGDGRMLLEKLAADSAFPGNLDELTSLVSTADELLGDTSTQIKRVAEMAQSHIGRDPKSVDYQGQEIL